MAEIGLLFIVLLIKFSFNNPIDPLRMYIEAFQLQYLGQLRVTVIHHSIKSKLRVAALRMSNIDPTQSTDDTPGSGIPSLLTYNKTGEEIVVVDHQQQQQQQQQQQVQQQSIRSPKKYHHLSVCMVPPESSVDVWDAITQCRIQFKDPGLYRWPPHANLLYPFIDIRPVAASASSCVDSCNDFIEDEEGSGKHTPATLVDPSIIEGLLRACQQIEPFHVRLHQFGTFGNNKRGVLWLYPDSYRTEVVDVMNPNEDCNSHCHKAPLVQLQELLVESFPYCNDQNIKSNEGFNPHMTISHFVNHHDALEAQKQVESWWLSSSTLENGTPTTTTLQFPVEYIYLLQRLGDSGQFLRVADIPLGS
jgi:2'-5' RNA ligase